MNGFRNLLTLGEVNSLFLPNFRSPDPRIIEFDLVGLNDQNGMFVILGSDEDHGRHVESIVCHFKVHKKKPRSYYDHKAGLGWHVLINRLCCLSAALFP